MSPRSRLCVYGIMVGPGNTRSRSAHREAVHRDVAPIQVIALVQNCQIKSIVRLHPCYLLQNQVLISKPNSIYTPLSLVYRYTADDANRWLEESNLNIESRRGGRLWGKCAMERTSLAWSKGFGIGRFGRPGQTILNMGCFAS